MHVNLLKFPLLIQSIDWSKAGKLILTTISVKYK